MDINGLTTLISAIIALASALVTIYLSLKKFKPEVKKLEIEVDSELVEASNLNLEGAKISAQMLLDRINELKTELDLEKKLRREEIAFSEQRRKDELSALEEEYSSKLERMEKIRANDVAYFRRRIKDLERESRDYRSWAARLSKQVVDAKLIPIPFVPTVGESDESITAVRPELETGPLNAYDDKDKKE